MIVNILHGRPLPVYGDGRNVRDRLHVSDHCRGIDLIVRKGRAGEVYNIGGRSECENIRLVRLLCAVANEALRTSALRSRYAQCPAASGIGADSLMTHVTDRAGHDRRCAIDCSKIERDLGYRAAIALEAGICDTFRWYVDKPAWWQAVLDGSYREWITVNYDSAAPEPP
jgi:dTDP-glucose 4,6-dehydratase